jgi:spermidine synthase
MRFTSVSGRGGEAQAAAGQVYAWNTLGAIAGSIGSGFFLVAWLGVQATYVAAAVITLGMGLALWQASFTRAGCVISWSVLVLACAAALAWYRPWDPYLMSSGVYLYGRDHFKDVPPGESYGGWLKRQAPILFYREGQEALVTVKEFEDTHFLQINGKTDASSGRDTASQKLLGHLPFLLHPRAGQALVIGWGSGATAASANFHPVSRLDCAELEPATLEASPFFEDVNFGLRPGGRFQVTTQDGRNLLLKSPRRYDVIISQPSNPWIHGISNLFTLDFYQVVRSRLAPGGVFCQWLQYYQLGTPELLSQFNTFCRVFPYVSLWMVPNSAGTSSITLDCIVLGTMEPQAVNFAAAAEMLQDPRISADLENLGSGRPDSLLANYVTDRQGIQDLAAASPLNTDDKPLIEFSAPRYLSLDQARSQELNLNNHAILDRAAAATASWYRGPWSGTARSGGSKALYDWGKLSEEKGLFRRAVVVLNRSLELDPTRGPAWLSLGNAKAGLGDVSGAEQAWLEAHRRQPDLKKALVSLGSLYYQQREFKKSMDLFEQVIREFPEEPDGYFGSGAAMANLGMLTQAEAMMNRCLELDPSHPLARKFLVRLHVLNPPRDESHL